MTDNAQHLPARPTIPAGSPEGAPAGEPQLTASGGCSPGTAADPRLAAPGGWSPYPPGMPEEDEINLLDLFIVLLKHKVMILSVVFLAGVAAVVISLLMTNIYRSVSGRRREIR